MTFFPIDLFYFILVWFDLVCFFSLSLICSEFFPFDIARCFLFVFWNRFVFCLLVFTISKQPWFVPQHPFKSIEALMQKIYLLKIKLTVWILWEFTFGTEHMRLKIVQCVPLCAHFTNDVIRHKSLKNSTKQILYSDGLWPFLNWLKNGSMLIN